MDKLNKLAHETSPYLLQHARNPVEWYPWGQEAITKAQQENKPILLSIGYAACHWCHVMAHESFEDQETAKLMNELFVNIKVDREERPDLDKIYQTTHYLLTERSGGWPLTTFLSPEDLTPFFSGTYFPLEPRPPLPPFKAILQKIAEIYRDSQTEIKKQNQSVKEVLQKSRVAEASPSQLNDEPIKLALAAIENTYDDKYGGFGDAPKFPHPTILEFLLEDKSPLALTSLLAMAEGGINDQLGGGFYRYSVDEKWQIPHFEKMLYDNAQLLFLYAIASKTYDEPYFAEVARAIANWVISEMQSPEGGYYSSLDADSEGHEGKFYAWDKDEIEKLLGREEFQLVKIYFGLDDAPNFENQYHFHIAEALRDLSEKKVLASAKQKLLSARNARTHPHRDEKILTAWNALMIKGMLVAGDILQEPMFINSAIRALHFIQGKLWVEKRLFANYKEGVAHLPAYLDDYAYLVDALLTATRITENKDYLIFAKTLADILLEDFYDQSVGGFFFVANNHEKLLYRPKTFMDEAIPAGNGVAVRVLLASSQLFEAPTYTRAATQTLRLTWSTLLQHPAEHCSLILGLKNYLKMHPEIHNER